MTSNTRSVFARISTKTGLYGAGIAGLAAAVLFSTGFARIPGLGDRPSPMVSTMAPFSDSTIAPLLALDRATEAVAERITPAVVNIEVVGQSASPAVQQGPQNIPAPFQQFFGMGPYQMQPQQPRTFQALGTGLIVSPDGYIVTNNHVVNGATHVQVTLNDKRQYDAKVVGTDKDTDLAVIKIDATGLTSAAFGDSSQLRPGETVLAIGDPMGMDFSVTRGIVSAVNRSRTPSDGPDARGAFIQTDAPINHGNSGGPLVDAHGDVVGINTEMLSTSGASAGIGFAIPSNVVKPVAASLIKNGKVPRGYLGIEVTDLNPNIADSLGESGIQGALVNQVNADSPAAAAGLKPYDVVTAIDGRKIASGSDLQTTTGALAPGTVAHLAVMRNGHAMPVSVTLGDFATATSSPAAADAAAPGNSLTPKLGVSVQALTPDIRSQLQLSDSVTGVVVASVTPGSPAMVAGIAQGDVIEQVNQHPVTSVQDLQHQLSLTPAGKDVLLMVHTANGDSIVPVHPQR